MPKIKNLSWIFCFLLIICGQAMAEDVRTKKPKVVVTIGMIADVVREIAQNEVEILQLMGSGVDPHLYKPTRSDIGELSQADLVLYNGLLLEGKMTDALVRIASSGRKVEAVTSRLDTTWLLEPPEFAGHYDPHVWMDPIAWKEVAGTIRDALVDLLPSKKEVFVKNTNHYLEKLAALDEYTKKIMQTVPEKSRVLVTAHDAFNYFGRRYGFEVIGIQGISTDSEAGVSDIEKIVSLLVDRRVPAVFVESTVSDRAVKALVEGSKVRGHSVKIGGQLFSDAMGKSGTYEGTYLGMIDHNVTTICRALGGQAPERGLNSKLEKLD